VLTNAKFNNCSLKNCNFQGAVLISTDFSTADMTGSDFRESTCRAYFSSTILNKVDLSGVDLQGSNTCEMKFREAKLVGTKGFNQIYGSDFYLADLRGADLSTVTLHFRTNFRKAKYDQVTRWPNDFDPKALGLIFQETKPEDDDSDEDAEEMSEDDEEEESAKPAPKSRRKSSPKKSNDEAAFQKRDANEDGVLSGKEMKGLEESDSDGDGEISLSEFLAGA
jgi:Pentapeptide repeats (8 copies)/EF hand